MEEFRYRNPEEEEEILDTSEFYDDIEKIVAKYGFDFEEKEEAVSETPDEQEIYLEETKPSLRQEPTSKQPDFRSKIKERMETLRKVEKQNKQAKRLLTSPEFIKGETITHAIQIEYLKDLIGTVDDKSLKAKLLDRLFKVKQSFQALQAYERYIEEMKHQWDGGWAFNKTLGKVLGTFYAGVFPTMGAVFYAAFNHMGTAALPLMGGAFGIGAVSKLALDEVAKLRLNKEFNGVLRNFIDLNTLSDNEELLSFLDRFEYAEARHKAVLEYLSGIKEEDVESA